MEQCIRAWRQSELYIYTCMDRSIGTEPLEFIDKIYNNITPLSHRTNFPISSYDMDIPSNGRSVSCGSGFLFYE